MQVSKEYSLLLQFIDKYLPVGFEEVNSEDPLLLKIDTIIQRTVRSREQLFFVVK